MPTKSSGLYQTVDGNLFAIIDGDRGESRLRAGLKMIDDSGMIKVEPGRRSKSFSRLLATTSILALGLPLAAVTSEPASAQTWTGATSTDWTTSSNWTGGVPSSGFNATITTTHPAVLGVSGAATGATNQLTVNGSGSLTIRNGGALSAGSATIASSGTVTVTAMAAW